MIDGAKGKTLIAFFYLKILRAERSPAGQTVKAGEMGAAAAGFGWCTSEPPPLVCPCTRQPTNNARAVARNAIPSSSIPTSGCILHFVYDGLPSYLAEP